MRYIFGTVRTIVEITTTSRIHAPLVSPIVTLSLDSFRANQSKLATVAWKLGGELLSSRLWARSLVPCTRRFQLEPWSF